MVSPNFKIDPPRDDEVKSREDRSMRKERIPNRNFREVAEQVDERRYREEDEKKTDKKSNSKKVAKDQQEPDRPVSLFDLVRGTKNSKEDKENESKKDDSELAIDEAVSKKNKSKDSFQDILDSKKISNPEFIPEHHDLSTVNPLAAAHQFNQSTISPTYLSTEIKSEMTAPAQNLQDIIDSITKEAYRLEAEGRTETIVTLKGNLFDQSRLILTEFDSAKGQFNITIDNLTQEGKNLLDLNQNSLLENLSKKGYMVHIMTTTTTIETPQIDAGTQSQDETKREGNPDQQNPNQQGQEEK